jgi:putative transposase
MSTSDLKRIKELESELAQFKRIVADLTLQNMVMKDVIEKKL